VLIIPTKLFESNLKVAGHRVPAGLDVTAGDKGYAMRRKPLDMGTGHLTLPAQNVSLSKLF
jgi:hypothetical protein